MRFLLATVDQFYVFCFLDLAVELGGSPRLLFLKLGVYPGLFDNGELRPDVLLDDLLVLIFQLHHS